jgi:arginyl-tRNA synthetase
MIVRKSDGGYLYATTDLAAALFRVHELHAQRIIYVVGMPQRQHFDMVFAALRHLGWVGPEVSLEHAGFGSVLGADGKMFRTREGETIRLGQLIDEARDRAAQVIRAKASERGDALDERRLRETASVIGLGALKYADLANDRLKDYVFDWDRMLAFEGNTAPYIQYSYTRIRSIFRRCAEQGVAWDPAAPLILEAQAERALALRLLQWPLAVESAGQSLEIHTLCACLHDLASTFHSFFESCPVLKAASPAQTQSRLRLCDGVARTLRSGLGLLGIDVVEQM